MLKRILLLALILGSAVGVVRPAYAACINGVSVVPFAFEQITVSTVSIGGTATTYTVSGNIADYALVTTETNPLRYRSDGSAPTSSVGHLANAGSVIEVCGKPAVTNLRMIRQGAADATVFVTYYKGF